MPDKAKTEAALDWFSFGLILVSIVTFSIETLPDLTAQQIALISNIELGIIFLFSAEYITRIFLAEKWHKYVFSFYGVIDIVALLPSILFPGGQSMMIRTIRLFRVLRLLKLARYHKAIGRLSKAINEIKEELVVFVFCSCILVFLAAVGIYHFEHEAQPEVFATIFDCIWWSVASLSTVGYGDIYPVTQGGRIFTIVVLMVGLGVIAVPAGLLASALSSIRNQKD